MINNNHSFFNAIIRITLVVNIIFLSSTSIGETKQNIKRSPHYTEVGFFDIHICNWPGKKLFFMSLFATKQFNNIQSVEVFYPDGSHLTNLDLNSFKLIKKKGKPEKHAFIKHNDVGRNAPEGWYIAKITMKSGEIYKTKDYVEIKKLPMVASTYPVDSIQPVAYTDSLSWEPVAKGAYYQVFIRDLWDNEKLIYTSKLTTNTSIKIPDGLLSPGGYYRWIIHARNVNEHVKYGDFNHGSMSAPKEFSFIE